MAMAVCSVCVMLTLLASGSIATGAGLDTSAMIQVVADVMAGDASSARLGFDSHSEFDEAATVELVFGAVLGTPSELTGSQDFGDREALVHASKELAKAWTEDASRLARETAKLALKRRESSSLAALEPHLDGTEAFEEIGNNARAGKMDWQQLNWVQKMSESHAAMTEKMMEKNIEWQQLASGTSLLEMRSTRIVAPAEDVFMVRRGLDKALGIKKSAGDAVVYTNMTKTLGEVWKKIATNSVMEAAGKQVKAELLDATAGGAIHSISDVGGELTHWLDEYAAHGKLNRAFFNVVGKSAERSGEFAAQWVDPDMRWAENAIGVFLALGTQALEEEEEIFGPVQVFSEAPVEIDEDMAGNVAEIVQRHMEEMSQRQGTLASAADHPLGTDDELRFEQVARFEVRTGHLTPKTLVRLKAITEESAGLTRMWMENTADLQKLISGVFMVMSQKASPARRTVVDDVKKGFERVMLKQEQLACTLVSNSSSQVSNSSSEVSNSSSQEALLPEGRLKLESLQRVRTIADDTLEMARHWFEKNQFYQRMTAGALAHFSTL